MALRGVFQDKLTATFGRPSACLSCVTGLSTAGLCPVFGVRKDSRFGRPLQRNGTDPLRRRKGSGIRPKSCVRMVLGSGGQQQTSSQQGTPIAPAWHPLEDLAPLAPPHLEGRLSPAECARTVVEMNEDGVLFTPMFPEGQSEGLDIAYVTNDQGEIYFEVDGMDWEGAELEFLEEEEVTVVIGYNHFDESGGMEEEDELEDEGATYEDSDSDDESDEGDMDDEDGQILSEYLSMLQSRGIPLEDMSVESFGTLGAYGGYETLETVHPLDFAIRLSDAVESQHQAELEMPQARVMLRGVVELVSPDEERRVRKEWLRRGLLAKEDEVHEAAASLLEELALPDEQETHEEKVQAARELADKALEQLRKDLERPQTRVPGSVRAAALFEKLADRDLSAEGGLGASSSKSDAPLERVHEHASSVPEQSAEGSDQEPRSNVEALLRKRLKVLKGFPRPGRSSEAKQELGVSEDQAQGMLGEGKTAAAVEEASGGIEEKERIEAGDVPAVLERQSKAVGPTEDESQRQESETASVVASDPEPTTSQPRRQNEDQEVRGSNDLDADNQIADDISESRARVSAVEGDTGGEDRSWEEEPACKEEQEAEERVGAEACASSSAELRQDKGFEASTSGSSDDTSLEPQILKSVDFGGLSRWLNSLESREAPIIWDQNRRRLWLGDDVSETSLDPGWSDALREGGVDLEGALWGEDDGEGGEDVAFWRGSDADEDTSDEEGAAEGPPLYRLRVTSVCFTSPTGVERTIDALDYAAAQPDTLCEASPTLMEQVNHAGHKVAHALVRLCKRMRGMDVDDAAMVAVDRYGFDLRVTQDTEMKFVRVSFPEVAVDEHHAMMLLEDLMWLNKKPDKKVFRFRRSALRRQMLELDEPGSATGMQ